MRPRSVGGYEPDDTEQAELHELYRLSLGQQLADRHKRVEYAIKWFLRTHIGEPHVAYKWVYVWAERHLGHIVSPDPVPE